MFVYIFLFLYTVQYFKFNFVDVFQDYQNMTCKPYLLCCDLCYFFFRIIIHLPSFRCFVAILSLFPDRYSSVAMANHLSTSQSEGRPWVSTVRFAIRYLSGNWCLCSLFQSYNKDKSYVHHIFIFLFKISSISIFTFLWCFHYLLNSFVGLIFLQSFMTLVNWEVTETDCLPEEPKWCWGEDLRYRESQRKDKLNIHVHFLQLAYLYIFKFINTITL